MNSKNDPVRVAIFTRGYTESVYQLMQTLLGEDIRIDSLFSEKIFWGNPLCAMLKLVHKYYFSNGFTAVCRLIYKHVLSLFRSSTPLLVNFQRLARIHDIQIFEITDFNSQEARGLIRSRNLDMAVVFGTRKLSQETFSMPRLGSINIHHGKLPEYRGSESIFWSLYQGEELAGVTIHRVDQELDAGAILLEDSVRMSDFDNHIEKIQRELFRRGNLLVASVLKQKIFNGTPQNPSKTGFFRMPSFKERKELTTLLSKKISSTSS